MNFMKFIALLDFVPFFGSEDEQREWLVKVLWNMCPEATSEEQMCTIVAKVLDRKGRPVDPRTVRNWAQKTSAPHFRYVGTILGLALLEKVLEAIEPEGESPHKRDLARLGAYLSDARASRTPPRKGARRNARAQSGEVPSEG